jgi:hypothetical protein
VGRRQGKGRQGRARGLSDRAVLFMEKQVNNRFWKKVAATSSFAFLCLVRDCSRGTAKEIEVESSICTILLVFLSWWQQKDLSRGGFYVLCSVGNELLVVADTCSVTELKQSP